MYAIAGTVTTLGGLTILLTGWWVWLKHKTQQTLGPDETARLKRAVDDLRLELDAVQRELSDGQQELHERLDFAERLLAQREPQHLPPDH